MIISQGGSVHILNTPFFDELSQGGILLGAAGYYLLTHKNKWGWVLQLSSQPFWFVLSLKGHLQWGLFLNTSFYTFCMLYGLYKWRRKAPEPLLKTE